jgi:signal transduction histidine kinase/CheY-like chemotaxis protein
VAHLAAALDVKYAFVGVSDAGGDVRTLAAHFGGELVPNVSYPLAGSPCEQVLGAGETVHVPDGAARRFPGDAALARLGVESYLGTPLFGAGGPKLGVLVVMDTRPVDLGREPAAILQIFAARAAAELERLRRDAERAALEEVLVRTQKLEGLGRLAGGVAHDFNNLLTVILSHAALAEEELPAGSAARELVTPIRDAAQRAATLTRQLLTFARKQVTQPRRVDVGDAVAAVSAMLRRLLGAQIEVVPALAPGLWPARVDPGQLEQVIVNLAVNARDAMPGGGRLVLTTANEPLGLVRARERDLPPGDYVRVSVADTGAGMDPETLRRAFDPFFTTKGDKGTGLGLATSLGIAQQAGGQLWAESAPGRGAVFHLLLPRATEEAPPDALPLRTPVPEGAPATVLVVEDEPAVRETAVRALRRAGHVVLAAADAEEALRLAERHLGRIDLLLTDVVLPGVNGPELARRLRAGRPSLRVLLTSGYAADEALRLSEAGAPFLPKPYTPDELATWVAELLTSPASSRGS